MKYSKTYLNENKNFCKTCEKHFKNKEDMKNSVRCNNCYSIYMREYMRNRYKGNYNYEKKCIDNRKKENKIDLITLKLRLNEMLDHYITDEEEKENFITKLIEV